MQIYKPADISAVVLLISYRYHLAHCSALLSTSLLQAVTLRGATSVGQVATGPGQAIGRVAATGKVVAAVSGMVVVSIGTE